MMRNRVPPEGHNLDGFGLDSDVIRMAKIWLRGQFLLSSQLPLCPPHRIVDFNIKKMVAYAKSKGVDGYPDLTYDCWRYVACNKLQMCEQLAELYFNVACDSCTSVPTLANESSNSSSSSQDKGKRKVPLLGFAVFLFTQQANRFNLRASMSGLEKRPRTYSETEMSARSRRSSFSFCGTLGQENIESKVMEFVLTNLQKLLELIAVYEQTIEDYHQPKSKLNSITWRSLVALDLIFEGCKTAEMVSVVPFSSVIKKELGHNSILIRTLEDFVRRNLQADPFAVCTPFCESPFFAHNDILPASGSGIGLKRSNSEDTISSADLPSDSNKFKFGDSKNIVQIERAKIRHNAKTAPKSHVLAIVNFVNRQTIIKNDDVLSNSILHIGKCNQAYVYLLAPFKTAVIRRCRGTTIVLGPTANVIRLQNCSDCTLVAMCRRLFVTDCQRCTIYVKTPSNPLIFGSTNAELTFAPFCTFYGDLENQMTSVGLTSKPDRWNEPLVFGNGEPKPVVVDFSIKVLGCWNLMDPACFYPISIPVALTGKTKNIPGGLPSTYKNALQERQKFFNEWNKFTNNLQGDERERVRVLVEEKYRIWLEKTGNIEQMTQLRELESQQQRRRHLQ